MKKVREFIRNRALAAQPLQIRRQGKYVAMVQWDGNGEDLHWVLVRIEKLKKVIKKMKRKAA
jgi:hypothetical protein